jgi:hypothetical protein
VLVGDNPAHIRSEGALAKLCGACPIPASSGKTIRYRLNRGGHRQANAALPHIIVTPMTTALLVAQPSGSVAGAEAHWVAAGTTGYTTTKVASLYPYALRFPHQAGGGSPVKEDPHAGMLADRGHDPRSCRRGSPTAALARPS